MKDTNADRRGHSAIQNISWMATMAVAGVAWLATGMGPMVAQQPPVSTPAFEVASVRPSKGCKDGEDDNIHANPGGLTTHCQTLMVLIQRAYILFPSGRLSSNFRSVAVDGGPSWLNSERYDISARTPANASPGMITGPMMQQLLEDRFKLKLHRETRVIPVYNLTVAKGGARLKRVEEGTCNPLENALLGPLAPAAQVGKPACGTFVVSGPPSHLQWRAYGMTLGEAFGLLHDYLGRVVIDKTGLTGMFELHLEFTRDDAAVDSPDFSPSIFTAVEAQLGLKLQPAKGPGEYVVIDSVEHPSEN
ncbi:MAG TPA: TIGR03435 family protein [Blastocatellia bacterium]